MSTFKVAYDLLSKHELMPDKPSVQSWLSTRKYSIGLTTTDEKHPGVFRTDDYPFDWKMYWTALALEVIGGVPIIFGAFIFGLTPFIIAIIGVTIGFLLDVELAKYLNRNQGYFKYIEGRLLIIRKSKELLSDVTVDEVDKLKRFRDDKRHNRKNTMVKIVLYLIAAFKTFFFIWFIIISPLIYVAIAFGYAFIAWAHIRFTGYKKAEDKFRKNLVNDYNRRLTESGDDDGDYKRRVKHHDKFNEDAYTPHTFVDASMKVEDKSIDKNIILNRQKDNSGAINESIDLRYRSIILDEEIEKMRDKQKENIAKDLVTIECLKTQFEKLPKIHIDTLNNKASWSKEN